MQRQQQQNTTTTTLRNFWNIWLRLTKLEPASAERACVRVSVCVQQCVRASFMRKCIRLRSYGLLCMAICMGQRSCMFACIVEMRHAVVESYVMCPVECCRTVASFAVKSIVTWALRFVWSLYFSCTSFFFFFFIYLFYVSFLFYFYFFSILFLFLYFLFFSALPTTRFHFTCPSTFQTEFNWTNQMHLLFFNALQGVIYIKIAADWEFETAGWSLVNNTQHKKKCNTAEQKMKSV